MCPHKFTEKSWCGFLILFFFEHRLTAMLLGDKRICMALFLVVGYVKAIFCIFVCVSIILCYSFIYKWSFFSKGWAVWKWTFEFAYVGTDSSVVPGSALCCREGICSCPVLPPRQAMLAGEKAWARCPGGELIHSFPLAASEHRAPPGWCTEAISH